MLCVRYERVRTLVNRRKYYITTHYTCSSVNLLVQFRELDTKGTTQKEVKLIFDDDTEKDLWNYYETWKEFELRERTIDRK